MEITTLGDSSFIVRAGNSLGKVLTTARRLEAAQISGAIDIAPALASVAVFFDSPEAADVGREAIRSALHGRGPRIRREPMRSMELPVCYEGEFAPDLEIVAQHCKLEPNEIVKRHRNARYRVRCLGFTPGFPYLSGLPSRLATPRQATPRTAVPAGSVAIGGGQTGIYPLPSPGGWNIIGRTPLRLFDPKREAPVLLRPGDRVRFVSISRQEFEQWES